MENTQLATADRNFNMTVTKRTSKRSVSETSKVLSRKDFFANKELSAQWEENYFKYRTAGHTLGVAIVEKFRVAGCVLAAVSVRQDKKSGNITGGSLRFAKAPRAGKSNAELAAANARIAELEAKLALNAPAVA